MIRPENFWHAIARQKRYPADNRWRELLDNRWRELLDNRWRELLDNRWRELLCRGVVLPHAHHIAGF